MPRRKSLLIGLACGAAALCLAFLRLNTQSLADAELRRLQELGVPLKLAELHELEKDRYPIGDADSKIAALKSHPSYPSFLKGSRYRPGTTSVDDLATATKATLEMATQLAELENALWSVEHGFQWKRHPEGYWRPESERLLAEAVSLLRRKLQVDIANRNLEALLDDASLLDHLSEQLYLTPGCLGSDLARVTQYRSLSGYASALQAGHDNADWLEAIEENTQSPLPKADLRLLTYELVPSTLAMFDDSGGLNSVRGAQHRGLAWIWPSHRRDAKSSWLKLIREHQEAAEESKGDPALYFDVWRDTHLRLTSDNSTVGRTVNKIWVDFGDVVKYAVQERARWAALRAAIAVLQYRQAKGALPKSLSELDVPKDPFTKTDLRYVQTPTGFIVYAPGLDGDQGGSRSSDFGVEIDFSWK